VFGSSDPWGCAIVEIKIALVIGQVSPVMYGLSSLTETIEPQNFLEKGGWVDTWIISCKQPSL